jgi:amino acid permease
VKGWAESGGTLARLASDRHTITAAGALLVLPLLFLRRINSLRYTAGLATACIWYVAALIVVGGVQMYLKQGTSAKPGLVADPGPRGFHGFNLWHLGVFYAVPNIQSAFQCQVQAIPIFAELRPSIRSVATMDRSIALATAVQLVLYVAVGMSGYYLMGDATPADVLKGAFPPGIAGGEDGAPLKIARVALVLVMLAQFPIQHFPARKALFSLLEPLLYPGLDDARERLISENSDQNRDAASDLSGPVAASPAPPGLEPEQPPRPSPRGDAAIDIAAGLFASASPATLRRALTRSDTGTTLVLRRLPSNFFYLSALAFWALCLLAAFAIPNLSVLFDISGVTIGPTIVFFTPAALLAQSGHRTAGTLVAVLGAFTTLTAVIAFVGEGVLEISPV